MRLPVRALLLSWAGILTGLAWSCALLAIPSGAIAFAVGVCVILAYSPRVFPSLRIAFAFIVSVVALVLTLFWSRAWGPDFITAPTIESQLSSLPVESSFLPTICAASC